MKKCFKYLLFYLIIQNTLVFGQLHHFQIEINGGGSIPSQTAGAPFFIEILAKDSTNATVTSFNGTVELSSNGILTLSSGTTSAFSNGQLIGYEVKFSNTGNFTLTAVNSVGIESGTSNSFTVFPNQPAKISVETKADGSGSIVPTQTLTAGAPLFIYSITRDTMNNFVSNYSASSWSLFNNTGGVTGTDLVPNPDYKGAVFTGHLVGSTEISATAIGLININSGVLTVSAANKSKLQFTQIPGNGLAGALLSPSPIIQLKDTYGNDVAESGDVITISIPPEQGTLSGTANQSTNNFGTALFSDLKINQSGNKTLIASSPSLTSAITDSFTLSSLIITASTNLNGVISPSGSVQVLYGASQSFIITPNTGYHLDSMMVDGIHQDSITSFTFTNIITNHSIATYFSINIYTITASSGAHGTISPLGTLSYNYGSSQTFSIISDLNYHIDSVLVDGASQGTISSFTFNNISSNHVISASFSADIPVANVKIFLQGAYSNGNMNTLLNGILPKTQPYNGTPWNYNGTESVAAIPSGVVDWVLIEIRSGPSSTTRIARRAAFIKSDGTIVDIDGISPVQFSNTAVGDYYIVIEHRNHLAVMSSTLILLNASSALYDFTTQLSKYYGNQAANLSGGKFGMFAGDYSEDNFIDSDDFIGPDNEMFKSGYRRADHSMDGFIDSDDFIWPDNNMFKSSKVPN